MSDARIRPLSGVELPSYVAGEKVAGGAGLEVRYPFDGRVVGKAATVGRAELERAIVTALRAGRPLSRFERHEILDRARHLVAARAEELASLILSETGLCQAETRYEVGRAQEVLRWAAIEALRDDGQILACDVSPQGDSRKIFTVREPLRLVGAITPFNHPLNQVVHKLAPAIAAGAPVILKPSEKTPLTALRFAEILYEAGLPGWMLSVLVGGVAEIAEPLVEDERVELLTFTGSVAIGKGIARRAGYKRVCLELGGHSPFIVLADADLDLAVKLAAEGCFRNSGQRCTAIRRILVEESIAPELTRRLVERARDYVCGDPADPRTKVGTVIDEAAARRLEDAVAKAVADGARLLAGGERRGALFAPTVLSDVPRTTELACKECFGPLAPILPVRDLDDAIALANASAYGLSAAIATRSLESARRAIQGIRAGTVNVNQVPAFRLESSPFGGVKDSGLGIKEGVVEAMKFMTNVKTFSLPW